MPRKVESPQRAAVQDLVVIAFRHPGTKEWTQTSLAGMARGFPRYEDWDRLEWYHEPPAKHLLPQVAWRPIWCGGYETVNGQRLFHHFECKPCRCHPGPQIRGLVVRAHEIATGGGRGSAKSELALSFLSKGDLSLADNHPLVASYLNSPKYQFLVLRKNAADLDEFFRRAAVYFAMFGGTTSDNTIHFPSGAWGKFDHVADGNAVMKYQGQEWTRIAWEEVGLEAKEENYLKILMSNRSSDIDMYEQMFVSANPGGPGAKWFNARFSKFKKPNGQLLKPGEIYDDPVTGKSRVFIFSTVDDNPYQMRKGYDKTLELLRISQPTLYQRWRHGNFDVLEGMFFEAFRENRMPGEPENACHVIQCSRERPEPVELLYYWPRSIGLDWGYSHFTGAAWGCWTPKKVLHVYREYAVSRKGTFEVGADIALKSQRDLERMPAGRQHMVIHTSPDAFARTDDVLTEAEQIARGINSIFGNDAAFVLSPTIEESNMDREDAWASTLRRQKEFSKRTHLTIVRAQNTRKPGWNLIRDYLRWWPLYETGDVYDEGLAREILEKKGVLAHNAYADSFAVRRDVTLPQLQIWSVCERLILALQSLVEKETDTEDVLDTGEVDIDIADALRYLVMGFPFTEADIPRDVFIEQKLATVKLHDPGISTGNLIMAARFAEWQFDSNMHQQLNKGFTIPRSAGPARRRMIAIAAASTRVN